MARIEAPVKINGKVTGVGGLVFVDGVVDTDDPAIIGYCRSAGYTVDGDRQATDEPTRVDARAAAEVAVGTRLRDAAVDPEPADFLPPVNAGEADPHGPDVVSPEIHGTTGRRVTPGKVSSRAAAQERAESAEAVRQVETPPVPDANMPARNASADEWRAYAVAKGMDRTEADNASRDELVRKFTA